MAENQVNLQVKKNTEVRSLIKSSEEDVPTFKTKIDLTTEDKARIWKEIDAELTAVEAERAELGLVAHWDSLDRQYEGEMNQNENMQFAVAVKSTAVKINAVVRALMEAFFEGEHVFSASPRPGSDPTGGREASAKQEDFLDYKIDEVIPLEEEMCLVAHSAALKGVGILKMSMKHKRKRRKAAECYDGTEAGIKSFLTAYPSAETEYPAYLKQLKEGKKLDLIVEYEEVVYDDPLPQFVDLKNFFVRKMTNGIDGLRDAYMTAELKQYTYWELKQEEKEEHLYDVDKLTYIEKEDDKGEPVRIENYASEIYDLWEIVFHTKIKDVGGKEDYVRSVFHISREKKSVHSGDFYPYWGVDTYYIPFYVKKKKKGFYQPGIGEDLTDSNLAENMLLCFALEGAYASNLITPIVKTGSKIARQFIEKRWTHGVPLEVDSKAETPDFLNKYFRPSNTPEMFNILSYLQQLDGSISGVSEAWATGKADPMDPSAPAMKTRDLLNQSGINVKDYIKRFGMSFNEVGVVMMQMYYQRNQRQLSYRIPEEKIAGSADGEFAMITRAEMAAKTNFQTQATLFDVDKLNAKKEDLAFWQVIRNEPLFQANEEAVYFALKSIAKGWSPKWRNNINKILPPMEQFKKARLQVAVEAVHAYMMQMQQRAQVDGAVTGQPAQVKIDPKQLLMVISTYLKEMATPPSPEQIKARQEAQKQGESAVPGMK